MNRGLAAGGAKILATILAVCPVACSSPIGEGPNSAAAATSGAGGAQVATAPQAGGALGVHTGTPAQGGQGSGVIGTTISVPPAPACPSSNGGDASSPPVCLDGGLAYSSNSDAGTGACPCADGFEALSGKPCDEFGLECDYSAFSCMCGRCSWGCNVLKTYRALVPP
jgi:hypothetical protein